VKIAYRFFGGFLFFQEGGKGGFFITWWARKGGCETLGFFLSFFPNFHNLARIKNKGVKCKNG